jgi:hypothetical protein
MKKILLVVLIGLAGASAFADGNFTAAVDTVMDALFIRSFGGDYASHEKTDPLSKYDYQGGLSVKAFQTSAFDDGLRARVKFAYDSDLLGGSLQLKAESGTALLGDWDLWVRYGSLLKILAGNTAQRGQIQRYTNFSAPLKTKIDNLGVMYPTWVSTLAAAFANNEDTIGNFPYGNADLGVSKGFAVFTGTDVNNLFVSPSPSTTQPVNFLLDFSFAPVTVSASIGGLFTNEQLPYTTIFGNSGQEMTWNFHDQDNDPLTRSGLNFGIRVEGTRLADMLTLSLVYKYADSYLYKPSAGSPDDLLKIRIGNQMFGAYATVTPVDGLGITVGYSGFIRTWKNDLAEYTNVASTKINEDPDYVWLFFSNGAPEVQFPFYNGVDLRFNYTGIDKLNLTFNNNITVAAVPGSGDREQRYAASWVYFSNLNADVDNLADRSETYLGLMNALGVKYAISDTLTADLQAANELGVFTLKWEQDPLVTSSEYLGLYAGVTHKFIKTDRISASLSAGAAVKMVFYTYYIGENEAKPISTSASYTDFGIPLMLSVQF